MQQRKNSPHNKRKKDKRERRERHDIEAVSLSRHADLFVNVPYEKEPLFDFHAFLSTIVNIAKATAIVTTPLWKIWPPVANLIALFVGDIADLVDNNKKRDKIEEKNRRIEDLDRHAIKRNELVIDESPAPKEWPDTFGLQPIDIPGSIFIFFTYALQVISLVVSVLSVEEAEKAKKYTEEGAKEDAEKAMKTEMAMLYASAGCSVASLFLNRLHQHFVKRNVNASLKQTENRLLPREKEYGKEHDKQKSQKTFCCII